MSSLNIGVWYWFAFVPLVEFSSTNSDCSSASRGSGTCCRILDSIRIEAKVGLGGKFANRLTLGIRENILRMMLSCCLKPENSQRVEKSSFRFLSTVIVSALPQFTSSGLTEAEFQRLQPLLYLLTILSKAYLHRIQLHLQLLHPSAFGHPSAVYLISPLIH